MTIPDPTMYLYDRTETNGRDTMRYVGYMQLGTRYEALRKATFDALKDFRVLVARDAEADITVYLHAAAFGCRVTEITLRFGSAGCSYVAADDLRVPAAFERLMDAYGGDDPDEVQEAKDVLRWVLIHA